MLAGPDSALFLLAVLLGLLEGSEGTKPFDPGLAIGDRLPAFEAVDQNGRPRTFASLRGPRGLVIVFFRSADW